MTLDLSAQCHGEGRRGQLGVCLPLRALFLVFHIGMLIVVHSKNINGIRMCINSAFIAIIVASSAIDFCFSVNRSSL